MLDAFTNPVLIISDNRIADANAAARALLGEHLRGQDVRTAPRVPVALEQLSEGSITAAGPTISLGGKALYWEMHTTTLPDGRRVVQLLDRSQERSLERAKGDFVANARHELRTPLAAILGFVETLGDESAGGDPATRARFLGVIQAEARRMQAVVDDLMSLSRIESNVHERPTELIDLGGIARRAVDELRDASGNPRQNIALDLDSSVPEIRGDGAQLTQLVRNLVDNATKYGRKGGRITISTARRNSGPVILTVADEGKGAAPEHVPRLTERFYRVDPGRSRAGGGTGLGLAIVKQILERHRGRLNIASELGVGTRVTVEFPTNF